MVVQRWPRQVWALAVGVACPLKAKEQGYEVPLANPEAQPTTVETDEFVVPQLPGPVNTELARPREISRPPPPSARHLPPSLEQPPVTEANKCRILPNREGEA